MKGKNEYRGSMTIETAGGEKKRIYVRGKSQREVNMKLAELKNQYEMGLIAESPNITLDTWCEEWLETYKKNVVTDGWYKDIQSIIRNHISPSIGSMRLSKIKPVHVQKCINQMQGLSWSTINKTAVIIKEIFKRALENKMIVSNPADNITLPKATKGERRRLHADEEQRLREVCQNHPFGAFFMVMLACGLRTGEAVALTWFNVDMKNKTITVTQSLENHSNRIKEPKTKAGFRTIPIPDWYIPYLENIKKTSQFVFTNRLNNMVGRKAIDGNWRKISEQAMLAPEITPYYLRHTYATTLAEMGVDMKTAQYLLGHSNISVTAKIYTHVSDKMLESARAKINGCTTISQGQKISIK